MTSRNYYIIIGFGRRLDNNKFDFKIADNKKNEFGLFDTKQADNRVYTFRLELESVFYIDDDFKIEIKKFEINS